ncbi:hypothetical protein ZOSMA_7G00800 [Zostera marina]|uniref:Uncharacterized protein n=1 Tax=Zostera marina TaxID=29655 RepID=A0A0K9NMS2_ZOSMR|nr:hypothetical protein ZOSMA_7G00800 [Zostera marina]
MEENEDQTEPDYDMPEISKIYLTSCPYGIKSLRSSTQVQLCSRLGSMVTQKP